MEESMSKMFDYGDVARKSVASTKYVNSVKASNGNTFPLGGSVIEFSLPTAVQRTFALLNGAYLKFKVTNNSAVEASADGSAGFASCVQRCEWLSSGGLLSSVSNWNTLYSALMDMGANDSGGTLNQMMGTAQSPSEVNASINSAAAAFGGVALAAGASRTVCVPMVMNPFSAASRAVPLFSADNLRLRVTLESAAAALISAGAVTDANVVVSEISLNFDAVTLSEDAFALVDSLVAGQYSILSTDWRCVSNNVAAGVSSATNIVGVSVSSAKRMLILPRNTVDVTDLAAASQANRTLMNISQVQANISGLLVPRQPITVEPVADTGRGSFALATTLASDGKLGDIRGGGQLGLAAAAGVQLYSVNTAAAQTNAAGGGKFLLGIDLTTHANGGSDQFSGLNLLGSNFMVDYRMDVATTLAATILYCVQFHTLISLDTRGSNTFRVSV